eukprot:scaffold9005_cov39-Tisochrysis_lutea.AAC.4
MSSSWNSTSNSNSNFAPCTSPMTFSRRTATHSAVQRRPSPESSDPLKRDRQPRSRRNVYLEGQLGASASR